MTTTVDVLRLFDLSEDRRAIAASNRNALILAGPGAGKTHLLVAHACWLAQQGNGRVLLLTFSRAAAEELRRRTEFALSIEQRRLIVAKTIHAHALDVLRLYGHRMGLSKEVSLIGAKDVQVLADEVARREGEEPMEDFAERLGRYQRLGRDFRAPELPRLVALVELEMRAQAKFDWDTCIRLATKLLAEDAPVRGSVTHHDRSVLIDEAQDCDAGQLAFIEQLVGPPPGVRHLFVVMDPNQSLYGFRQANSDAVLAWALKFAKTEIDISENFRCSPRIQRLAGHVLERTPLVSGESGSVSLLRFLDPADEAKRIAADIQARIAGGAELPRIAVLARRRSRLAELEAALAGKVEIRRGSREQWAPNEERVLAALAFIKEWRDGEASSDLNLRFLTEVAGLTADEARALESASLVEAKPVGDLLRVVWWQDLVGWLEAKRSPEEIVGHLAPIVGAAVEEIDSLLTLGRQARSLAELLRLARAGPEKGDSAKKSGLLVTTFHGAKGLEFETVYVLGCEDGSIPDFRAKSEEELRDERRGLYVAITRASTNAVLTQVEEERGRPRKLSRFLPEVGSPLWSESH